jgi:6-phosphogluconate dehydrogenase
MVHNGIEYGDMQIICEAYQLLSEGLGLPADEIQAIFAEWNKGVLDCALIPVHFPVPFWPAVSKILSTKGSPSSSLKPRILVVISIK